MSDVPCRHVPIQALLRFAGTCVRQIDLSEMSTEEKLAVARHCQVQFPSQVLFFLAIVLHYMDASRYPLLTPMTALA
jgi:hypothetical protein